MVDAAGGFDEDEEEYRSVHKDAFSFETDVALLRKEVRRVSALYGVSGTSVTMSTVNAVPDVLLHHLPKIDNINRAIPQPLLDVIQQWHAAHTFCRIKARSLTWPAESPWDPTEWRSALRDAIDDKKAERSMRGPKRTRPTSETKRPAKRTASTAPDTFTTLTLFKDKSCSHYQAGEKSVFTVNITASPRNGTIKLQIITPGHEQTVDYKYGDCVWSYNNICDSSMREDYNFKRITSKCVHVDRGTKRYSFGEFAANIFKLKYNEPPKAADAARAVKNSNDLDVIAAQLAIDPTSVNSFINVIEAVPDTIVPSTMVFAALNSAHERTHVADEVLRARINALLQKFSKQTELRVANSL